MKTVTCKNNTMIIPKTAYISLSQLSDADLGKYIRMIFDYGFSDIEPEVSPLENAMLAPIFDFIKNSKDSYDKVSESRKKAANARWNKQMDADNANACECMQVDANDALNNNKNIDNKIDRNKNREKKEGGISLIGQSPTSEQLSIYQPLFEKFKNIHGMAVYSIDDIYKYAAPLVAREFTIQDMLKVIDCKAKEWKGTQVQPYIRPQTLFKADKFDEYLAQANSMNPVRPEQPRVDYSAAKVVATF